MRGEEEGGAIEQDAAVVVGVRESEGVRHRGGTGEAGVGGSCGRGGGEEGEGGLGCVELVDHGDVGRLERCPEGD